MSLNGSLLGYSFQPWGMLLNLASARGRELAVYVMGMDGAASG